MKPLEIRFNSRDCLCDVKAHVTGQEQKRALQSEEKRFSKEDRDVSTECRMEKTKETAFQDLLVNFIAEIFPLNTVSAKMT